MEASANGDLRYPIGKFLAPAVTGAQISESIAIIAKTPSLLRAAVAGLGPEQIDTPYRPGGWTVRQVVHHLADSHMNAFLRFRHALTEAEPTIKTYDEKLWAALPDSTSAPVEPSLALLEGLHDRWVTLLKALTPAELGRKFNHPERGLVTLAGDIPLFAWHGRHHVAHIVVLRTREGW